MLMDRHEPKLTQADLAKKAGVSQKSISNMLNPDAPGVLSHTLEKVEKVASAFGLTAWHLLIPMLPDDSREYQRISDLVADYLVSPQESRQVIIHTAEREKRLAGRQD